MLSIVIPTLNEEETLAACLQRLAGLRAHGAEIIVADGGSTDQTCAIAKQASARVIHAPRGRGAQMNAGAHAARGDTLLFLHADTILPEAADDAIRAALASGHVWGRFDVEISGRARLLRLVARLMNLRSRLTAIATGDQAIFVTRAAFEAVGGYPDIALMEDIALSKALKRRGPPACLAARAVTSGRRWEARGIIRTILLMWALRAGYALGVPPTTLARLYGYEPRDE